MNFKGFIKTVLYGSAMTAIIIVFNLSCSKKVDSTIEPKFVFKSPVSSSMEKSTLVAKIGKNEVTFGDLSKGIEGEIYDAQKKLYDLKYNRLKALILERLIDQHPDKKDRTNDQFLETVIAKGISPSDKDVEKFIKTKKIPAQHVNPAFKERIKKFLVIDLKRKAIDGWMAKQTNKIPIEIYLNRPVRPWFDIQVGDAPVKGSEKAKITIVEYSDFQCPYCERATGTLNQLSAKYKGKVKIVFKHFPMPFHKQAQKAAEASLCANDQGNKFFWKMHDAMFGDQTNLRTEDLKTKAKNSGLDTAKFNSCLDTGKYAAKVKADMKEGELVGVKATPTFFINGRLINGAQSLEVFSEVIDRELQVLN